MFTAEETIKDGCFTIVERGSWKGSPVVRKQYREEQTERYFSEKQNLNCLSESQYPYAVGNIFTEDKSRSLVYPYVEGEQGYDAIDSPGAVEVLPRLIGALSQEAAHLRKFDSLPFSFIAEGYKTKNEPFFYSKLMAEMGDAGPKQLAELGRLLKIKPLVGWGRYDPEFSNSIVTAGEVFQIDYEVMSRQDSLFPHAYALVHLELNGEKSYQERFAEIAKDSIPESLCKPSEFNDRMRLNIAEVCAYLILETKREVPEYRDDPKLERKLNKLEGILGTVI